MWTLEPLRDWTEPPPPPCVNLPFQTDALWTGQCAKGIEPERLQRSNSAWMQGRCRLAKGGTAIGRLRCRSVERTATERDIRH